MTTGLFAYCNPLFGGFQLNTLRNRIQYFQSAKSVEIIIQKLKSDSSEKFIEFLSSSPLDRAITYLDIVARRVLLKIKSALTEKNAEDLIKLEETVAKPKKNDENKKKKKKRKKNKKNKHVEKTQDQDGSEIAKSLLDSIMDKLYVQAQKSEPYYTSNDSEDTQVTDEPSDFKESPNEESSKEEFKKVEIHKRKYKKPNVQQKQKITKKNPQKHNSPKVENNLPNQIHKKTPKKSFQWQSPPISAQETTVSSELEFPPLSASSFSPKNGKKLHHEILKYCKNIMKNTTEKSVTIMILINRLAECIKSLFPMVTIELFGSYRSGLALEDSDIDLAIINSGLFNRVDIQKAVLQVGETLQLFPWVSKCKAISTATIPVVKLEVNPVYICEGASAGTIMVDLSFDDAHETIQGSHLGMSTLLLTQRLLYDYPYLQYLVMVLKKLLYSHSLNSAYHGGLSSYSLNIWITAYLNITPPVDDCGQALLGFLDFYGNQFDHKRYGIDINNGGAFYVLPENHYENVVTIDPINQDNNTTRASYNITEVLKLFSRVHSKLIELKDTGKPNVLNQIFRR